MRDYETSGSYTGDEPLKTYGNCKSATPKPEETPVVTELRRVRNRILDLQEQQTQQLYIIDQLLSVFTI